KTSCNESLYLSRHNPDRPLRPPNFGEPAPLRQTRAASISPSSRLPLPLHLAAAVAAAASPSLSPSLLPPPRHLPLAVAIAASLSQRHPRRRYLPLPAISHSPSRLPQVLHPRRPSTVGGLAVALQPRPVGPSSSASNATRKERPPHLPPRPPRRTRSGPPRHRRNTHHGGIPRKHRIDPQDARPIHSED
ncbi:unnamed protein product, partial [Urochloa humidicola]